MAMDVDDVAAVFVAVVSDSASITAARETSRLPLPLPLQWLLLLHMPFWCILFVVRLIDVFVPQEELLDSIDVMHKNQLDWNQSGFDETMSRGPKS